MHMLATRTLSRALIYGPDARVPAALRRDGFRHSSRPGCPRHLERDNLVFEGMPPLDGKMAARLDRYQQSRQATFLDWQADGSMLVATRFGDASKTQVHRVANPLGMREQLTFTDDPVSLARAPATGGAGFAFLKDHDGDENGQVYYYGGPGNVRQLTTGNFQHGSLVWSHDGKNVAFFGNERDGHSDDVYMADVSVTAPPRLVVGGQQDTWYPLDWSADDRRLLLWKFVSVEESYLYIADVASGSFTPVDTTGRKFTVASAKFAPDGRGIYLVSVEDGDFAQLRYLDPVSHEERKVSPDIQWDVESFDVSVDGRYIAYVVNEDGRSHLTVLDSLQKIELTPPDLPEGQISNIRFDRTR